MKKTGIILLICIYTLSAVGIGVREFYCCGKLKSTTITFVRDSKENCGKSKAMGDCCKTKFKNLKVKDSHIVADGISTLVKHFIEFNLYTPSFGVTAMINESMTVANTSHAPPLNHGVPIYILHCIYRI